MGYSFRLAARVLLYASSHRQNNTYHGLCYTSRGALAGKKEIFYLTMHSTHFNYGYMVQDHSDNERGNLLPLLHGQLFPITNKVLLYVPSHRQDSTHHRPFLHPVVEWWLRQEIPQWNHHEGLIRWPITPWAGALPWIYISLWVWTWWIFRCFSHIKNKTEKIILKPCSIKMVSLPRVTPVIQHCQEWEKS